MDDITRAIIGHVDVRSRFRRLVAAKGQDEAFRILEAALRDGFGGLAGRKVKDIRVDEIRDIVLDALHEAAKGGAN
jgi:hypothetical protein